LAALQLPPNAWPRAGGLVPREGGAVVALALCLLALQLQGCDYCAPATPSLGWTADLERMDDLAGCKDGWTFMWGDPCASDIPVVRSKKGFREDVDGDFVRGRVENEAYRCTQRGQGGHCAQWTSAESSCDEEDFGICTCKQPSGNGKYCHRWQCISKEASQNLCWKGCCGDTCDPCIQCGVHGSSPFPMDEAVFRSLVTSDGTSSYVLLGPGGFGTSDFAALAALRRAHWTHFTHNGECIMPRDVKSVHETPCGTWREVETEIANCGCTEAGPSGRYCHKWKCEEKDVGMFSVLFAEPKSYSSYLSGHEEEFYTCLERKTNGDQERCTKWQGDIIGYEEVEVTQCLVAPHCAGGWCDDWVCNEYELPRVHDEDQWGKRLGFSVLHFLWLVPPCCVAAVVLGDGLPPSCVAAAVQAGLSLCIVLVLWAIAFVRHHRSEGRWVRPGMPLLVMLSTLWLPFAVGAVLAQPLRGKSEAAVLIPAVLSSLTFVLCGTMWTCGLVGVLVLVAPLVLCACAAAMAHARA